jgi:antitoxin component YwqK of YwqJK toxin-antitoxin module
VEVNIYKIYYKDGKLLAKIYYAGEETNWHREDGPAEINYDDDGNIESEEYWLNDQSYTKEEFLASKEHQEYLANKAIMEMLNE